MIAANVQSRLNKIWPKLRITCKPLATALKKNSRLFTIFPDFFQIGKIAGQIWIPDPVQTLKTYKGK